VNVIYIVFPLAMLGVVAALAAFIWSVRRGQYDDMDTPALRILEDDDDAAPRREA